MIVHTIPEAYISTYAEIADWIDARFAETKPEARYIRHINTRLDHADFEKRDLADWIESPLIRPEIMVDLPQNYGFNPAFYQGSLHAPFHVVFADDQADIAAEFEAAFLG